MADGSEPTAEAPLDEPALSERVARLEGMMEGANAVLEERHTSFARSTTHEIGKQIGSLKDAFGKMLDEHDKRIFGESEDGSRALTFSEALKRENSSRRTLFWDKARRWAPWLFAAFYLLTTRGGTASPADTFAIIAGLFLPM